jgi:hypothetical protein
MTDQVLDHRQYAAGVRAILSALFEIGFWAAAIVLAILAPPYVRNEWLGAASWNWLSTAPIAVAFIACLRMGAAHWDVKRVDRFLSRD